MSLTPALRAIPIASIAVLLAAIYVESAPATADNYSAAVVSLWPVTAAVPGATPKLWAQVRNISYLVLPSDAKVVFWVDGPNWAGTHWVGSTSAAALAMGTEQWFSFDWHIPIDASVGNYTYWAQVWTNNEAISAWSTGQSFEVSRIATSLILSEDFEDNNINSQIDISTKGSFGSSPGIRNTTVTGSNKAFGFGKSTCGASCFWNYVSYLNIRFSSKTYVSKISFKSIEVDGDWGSAGQVNINLNPNECTFENRIGAFHEFQSSTGLETFNIVINADVNNIVLLVRDVTSQSEIYIDDLAIYGANVIQANVAQLWPVSGATPAKTSTLWAMVGNTGTVPLPSDARAWFYVDGPNWENHWIGSVSVAGLAPGANQWYSFNWLIPAAATAGDYKYQVQVWTSSAISAWSVDQAFSISQSGVPGKAMLVSPTGQITTSTPSYTWNAVPAATWYQLWVNDSITASGKIKTWYTATQAGCDAGTGTCSVTPATPLVSGEARWWIQTWNDNGFGPWSDSMQFTVTANTSCVPLPVPVLTYTGKSDYIGSDGNEYTMYRLNVENKNSFQDNLFVLAPELPPCGLNTNSSRTWVLIYFSDGSYIYGFCGLKSSVELGSLWFEYPRGKTLPYSVYIVINDRKCSLSAASNQVRID